MAIDEGDETGAGSEETGRVLALADGVFAIAMTLLVLDLAVPEGLHSAEEVDHALGELLPNILAFLLSFAVIGRYWMVHRDVCKDLDRVDVPGMWLNILFLLPITLMPFTAKLLADYGEYTLPTVLYATNIAVAGICASLFAGYAERRLGRPGGDDVGVGGLSVVAVFLVSIPIAVFSPDLAKVSWILIPVVSIVALRVTAGRRAPAT